MADVAELGAKVKSKYPGVYDDMDPAELGRRVKAKHPGAYDDFSDVPAAKADGAQRGIMDEVGSFVGGAAKHLNPVTMLQGVNEAIKHPIDTAGSMLGEQGRPYEKATASSRKMAGELRGGEYGKAAGSFVDGVRHTIGWLLPFIGPAIDEAGDKAASGEPGGLAEGLGEAAGLGLQPKVPGAVAETAGTVAGVAGKVGKGALKLAKNPAVQDAALGVIPKGREVRALVKAVREDGGAKAGAEVPPVAAEKAPKPAPIAEKATAPKQAQEAAAAPVEAPAPAKKAPRKRAAPKTAEPAPVEAAPPKSEGEAVVEKMRAAVKPPEAGKVIESMKEAAATEPPNPFEAYGRHKKAVQFADHLEKHGISADDVPNIKEEFWSGMSKEIGTEKPPSAETRTLVHRILTERQAQPDLETMLQKSLDALKAKKKP